MLRHVFLSLLVILGHRDLIHLNIINHLLKCDLGGEPSVLPVLADARQLPACCGFHYFGEFSTKEGKASLQKVTSSLFAVTIINLDDLKSYLSEKRTSLPRGGSVTPQMRPGLHPALGDRS